MAHSLYLFIFKITLSVYYLFLFIWLSWFFISQQAFLQFRGQGLLSSCAARTSHFDGKRPSVVAVPWALQNSLSSCGTWGQLLWAHSLQISASAPKGSHPTISSSAIFPSNKCSLKRKMDAFLLILNKYMNKSISI